MWFIWFNIDGNKSNTSWKNSKSKDKITPSITTIDLIENPIAIFEKVN